MAHSGSCGVVEIVVSLKGSFVGGLVEISFPLSHFSSRFNEDPHKGHWYPTVLKNPATQSFMDKITSNGPSNVDLTREFTLTVTSPTESGPLRGWRIYRLKTPGRLGKLVCSPDRVLETNGKLNRVGRLTVRQVDDESYIVQTSNVQAFSVPSRSTPSSLILDEQNFCIPKGSLEFKYDETWTVCQLEFPSAVRNDATILGILTDHCKGGSTSRPSASFIIF